MLFCGVAVEFGDGDADGVGFIEGDTGIPLFQTNFLPDLIQVNLLPAETAVAPNLEHEAPGFGATAANE